MNYPNSLPRANPRDRILTVSLVILCQIVHGISFSAMPLLLPLIREDLHITFTQAGLLSAAATFSYALGQIPAGFLSDRYGPKRLFFIGLLGWSVFSVFLGLIHLFWMASDFATARGHFPRPAIRARHVTAGLVVSAGTPRHGDEPLHARRLRRHHRALAGRPAAVCRLLAGARPS